MKKTFNVLCITRRMKNDSSVFFHLPAESNIASQEDNHVEYWGKVYPLEYTRKGLDSSAVVLGLETGHGILELYTDTPAEGSTATPESIRENARRTVKCAQLHRERRYVEMAKVASGEVDPDSVK